MWMKPKRIMMKERKDESDGEKERKRKRERERERLQLHGLYAQNPRGRKILREPRKNNKNSKIM